MITPNFHFKGNCKEAIEVYKKAFDFQIVQLMTSDEGFVYHGEALLYNQRVYMTDDTGMKEGSNPLSLAISFKTDEAVIQAFDILKEEAVMIHEMQSTSYASAFVSFVDRFGMRWELMTERGNDQ